MKRTIVAILAMSPALMFGQTQSPAQPSSTPTLQASVHAPAGFVTSVKSTDTAGTLTTPLRVSTGIVPPQIVYSADINRNRILPNTSGSQRTVVVSMTVDQTGTPVDLKVVKSADLYTDAGVLQAVKQYRFKPATLDNQAVPMTVNLAYELQ